MNSSSPIFAVVGHPNKGKSSIVSTLSQNDAVEVSGVSGTTKQAQRFDVDTTGGSYALIDTPGFQRPTKVLDWLTQHCKSVSERFNTVKRFVNDPVCQRDFVDEVELLQPIVAGAAILYVVDGSRPYGPEYEAEMEILRWTGQPSMALINPIESDEHIEQWRQALNQYFKSVRVFNPMTAEFEKQIELLKTFSFLNINWQVTLAAIVDALSANREQQAQQALGILTELLVDLCQYQYCQKVLTEQQGKKLEPIIKTAYHEWMTRREQQAVEALLTVYRHAGTQVVLDGIELPPDLFDTEKWYAWGLTKTQLTLAAAAAGAVGGAALDIALVGHSLMLGAIGGSLMGASGAWLSADKLLSMKIKNLPMGGHQACIGPIKSPNFPYVVVGRFVYMYRQITKLTHANRRVLTISAQDFQQSLSDLSSDEKKRLHTAFAKLSAQKNVENLGDVLGPLLCH